MSGFGERFRAAGYALPKPLIEVDGKPIIAHVIDMFPGETDFLFICNQEHLNNREYMMAEKIRRYCPQGRIVGIEPHREGPIGAVLRARQFIKPSEPVVVNYCDFTCYWDWDDFKRFVSETACAGAIPAYRGFHPHSLGSTYYAYMREKDLWLEDIQEKKPFTDAPLQEFASSGTYYFESGQLCIDAFQGVVDQKLLVGGEYYASMSYKILLGRSASVAVYELQHFMQWGTPQDLEEYQGWSAAFRRLAFDSGRRSRQSGVVLVPMAGYGKRFSDDGYVLPKPLIPVSGRPMVIQATRDLPDAPATRFVLRRDTPGLEEIQRKLRTSFVDASVLVLDEGTQGQAITARMGLEGLDDDAPITIGACDNAMLYDPKRFEALMDSGGADVLVWVVRGHADGKLRPTMFGWVEAGSDGRVTGVRVKQAPGDPARDPMIVGAFTFRRKSDFDRACARLVARDGRVNGEFYIDSMMDDVVALGLDCRLFEIDHYLGWGTPNDLKRFEYWQSCFHKWKSHPYRLERDRRVPSAQIKALAERFKPLVPARPPLPGQHGTMPAARQVGGLAGEGLRFLPIGVIAVLIDLAVYLCLTWFGLDVWIAKGLSFICGALFAFAGNRYFTFRKASGARGFAFFWLVYLTSLGLNVGINSLVLAICSHAGLPEMLPRILAFLAATSVSAATNFAGMKLLVFRGKAASSGI